MRWASFKKRHTVNVQQYLSLCAGKEIIANAMTKKKNTKKVRAYALLMQYSTLLSLL